MLLSLNLAIVILEINIILKCLQRLANKCFKSYQKWMSSEVRQCNALKICDAIYSAATNVIKKKKSPTNNSPFAGAVLLLPFFEINIKGPSCLCDQMLSKLKHSVHFVLVSSYLTFLPFWNFIFFLFPYFKEYSLLVFQYLSD